MKLPILKLFSALLALTLLAGCAPSDLPEEDTAILPAQSGESPTEEQSFLPEMLALPYDPAQSLDPVACPEGMQQVVGSLLFEGLFRLDETFTPQPWLCESYTYAPETARYVFTLREAVFSDGSPLTAADVKATLDRAKASQRYGARLAAVTSVTARDMEVTVTLSSPNTSFPALLDIPIIKKGTESTPMGTGPYFFSQEENGAYLIASQSWWRGEPQPTERIALTEADGHDAMLYRFTSRDVQLICADLTGNRTVSITGNAESREARTTIFQFVGINTRRLEDPALRCALSLGIHRENIVEAYLSGHGIPAQLPLSPASPLYPSHMESTCSTESFTAALAACALPDRPLRLVVNGENDFKVAIAHSIAESYTAAGVETEVAVLPWEEYLADLAAGNFDLYYGEVRLTADWDLGALLRSGGALNYGGWADPQTDQLLANYAASADPAADMEFLCGRLKMQAPILPVCFKSVTVLTQAEVFEGLSPTAADPFYGLSSLTVHLK